MVGVNVSYPDTSAGEVTPDVRGRFDLSVFFKGMRRIVNWITSSTGMARFRTGTVYVGKTRLNQMALLSDFRYSDDVAYILEFTNFKLRFHSNNGQVRKPAQAITNITQANPAVVTYSGSDTFANGESVYLYGIVGMIELNDREYVVANVNTGANTFELSGVDSTGYRAYSSGGYIEEIVEVTTPFAEADLFRLKFAQDGKNLYIAHPSYNPQKLTYTSATSWAIANHAPVQKTYGVYQGITNITRSSPGVLTYTGADNFSIGESVKITGVSGMTEVNDTIFTVRAVNTGANAIELNDEDGNITDFTGYTAYSSGGIIREIKSSAASFLTTNEYPAAVGMFEERLVYGGSNNGPKELFFSCAGDYDDFTLALDTDDVDKGFAYTVSGDIGRIVWLKGTPKFLAIGGYSDIGQLTGGVDTVVTAASVAVRPSNSYGAADINPIGKGSETVFLQNNRRVVRSHEYDLSSDAYLPVDLNQVADHITKTGLTQLSFQEGRPNVMWSPRVDGWLVGRTTEVGESVSGWHRHQTDGLFISAASMPRSTEYDQLWVCVKRTINGTANYYVEYFADPVDFPDFEDYIDIDGNKAEDWTVYQRLMYEKQKEYIHLDCSLSYYGDQLGLDASATMTPGEVTGTGITFTSSAPVFNNTMVGREIWRKSVTGKEYGRARIITYVSPTVVVCEILEAFDSVTAIPAGEWYLTASTFTNLSHLEGKTVCIVADGAQHAQQVVTGGTITLSREATVVHIGLKYIAYLETNDLEGGGINGTAQTKRKSVFAIGFRFLHSLYAKFGTNYYNLKQIEMRTAAMRMDRPPEMFSGDIYETIGNDVADERDGGWARSKRAIVVQDQPFPCNVQLIVPYMNVTN